ncbi:hypothetical protein P280DRAFT_474798 [Massarina eburnea CBS 473.64]|uniref:Uncharacterized protein n=1 Tax=Massarina eburnea CBS 473.64 TaxID=1395130 RepID=A0A6A6RG85_9PLEO|nr:hypothetical protein P280DRAFT_474798 [Massarina eburnea CBS 473.64]
MISQQRLLAVEPSTRVSRTAALKDSGKALARFALSRFRREEVTERAPKDPHAQSFSAEHTADSSRRVFLGISGKALARSTLSLLRHAKHSKLPEPSKPTQTSMFLNLPPELRNRIYAIIVKELQDLDPRRLKFIVPAYSIGLPCTPDYRPLGQVCQQIREEFQPLYYHTRPMRIMLRHIIPYIEYCQWMLNQTGRCDNRIVIDLDSDVYTFDEDQVGKVNVYPLLARWISLHHRGLRFEFLGVGSEFFGVLGAWIKCSSRKRALWHYALESNFASFEMDLREKCVYIQVKCTCQDSWKDYITSNKPMPLPEPMRAYLYHSLGLSAAGWDIFVYRDTMKGYKPVPFPYGHFMDEEGHIPVVQANQNDQIPWLPDTEDTESVIRSIYQLLKLPYTGRYSISSQQ